jgi:hypothetical protein
MNRRGSGRDLIAGRSLMSETKIGNENLRHGDGLDRSSN